MSFKAIKAKKATLVARNTKLQTGKFVDSKILSYHLVRCFDVPFVKFGTPFSKEGILKAKTYPKGHKIGEIQIFNKPKIKYFKIMNEICFIDFFDILQFCGLWGMFWPLKSLILKMGSKI